MAGFLNIVAGDTKGTRLQVLENTDPMDLTDKTLTCKIGTSPTTIVSATIVDAVNGEASVVLGSILAGSYEAAIVITDAQGSQTSEYFTVNVRKSL